MLTNGPMLFVTANGAHSGDVVTCHDGIARFDIKLYSQEPVKRILIYTMDGVSAFDSNMVLSSDGMLAFETCISIPVQSRDFAVAVADGGCLNTAIVNPIYFLP